MRRIASLTVIERGILLFWGLWFALAASADVSNFLQVIAWIPMDFPFSSKNYDLVVQSFHTYGVHQPSLLVFCYGCIIVWAFVIALAFLMAFLRPNHKALAHNAFLISFMLTAFFILMDEIFLQYEFEHNHVVRLGFQLLTFVVFYLLSQKPNALKHSLH